MTLFKKFLIVLKLALFIFTTACDKDPSPQQVVRFEVTGDPMAFIQGTKQNTSAGIPADLFDNDDEWQLHATAFFTQKQTNPSDFSEVKDSNAPTTSEASQQIADSVILYKMSLSSGNRRTFDTTSQRFLRLGFVERNNRLFLSYSSAYENLSVQDSSFVVQHYSTSHDRNAFSILVSSDADFDPEIVHEKLLISMTFIKKKSETILGQMLDTAYNYILGPGVKLAWDQSKDVDVTICDKAHAGGLYSRKVEEAVEEWQPHLEGRLRLGFKYISEACPPFSDVNTHVVTFVPDWVELQGPDFMIAASTGIVRDYYQSRIVDADIFLFEAEWNEALSSVQAGLTLASSEVSQSEALRNEIKWTMAHELGHLLGLDHQFDGTLSVMSYDDAKSIYSYDQRAIQELYPLVETTAGTNAE